MKKIWSLILLLTLTYSTLFASPVFAQFIVLSGGGGPASNHYSQYLQTKNLYEGLVFRFGQENVSLAFGAGNRPAENPIIADVHKTVKETIQGVPTEYQTLIVGSIKNNQEANHLNLENMLKEQTKSSGPLFIFVSDHGMPNEKETDPKKKYSNNCIDLWSLDILKKETKSFHNRCLTRNQLENLLNNSTSNNKIYGMSQCFSGGFHYMTVKTMSDGNVTINPKLCGFTATTEDLTSSGCTPYVDGPNYAGYERFFTKHLIGQDFIDQVRTTAGVAKNVRDAHQLATLDDYTADIPLSSSDFYLLEIYKSLAQYPSANFSTEFDVTSIQKFISHYSNPSADPLRTNFLELSGHDFYQQQSAFAKKVSETIAKKFKSSNLLMFKMDFKNLANQINKMNTEMVAIQSKLAVITEKEQLISKTNFFPIWESMVNLKNPKLGLSDKEFELEAYIVHQFGLNATYNTIINQHIAFEFMEDAAEAQTMMNFLTKRQKVFGKYFFQSVDPNINKMAAKIAELEKVAVPLRTRYQNLQFEYQYARRILSTRQILGVLGAAVHTKSTKIIKNYADLIHCEMTPLDSI